jgi:hypothetical protein
MAQRSGVTLLPGNGDDTKKLILQAAAYATGEGKCPEVLEDYFNIENWGSPDPAIGWLDWPIGWRLQMQAARNVYTAFHAYQRQADGERGEWLGRNPDMAKIITLVWEMSGVMDTGDVGEGEPTVSDNGFFDSLPPDLPPEARAAIEARQRADNR